MSATSFGITISKYVHYLHYMEDISNPILCWDRPKQIHRSIPKSINDIHRSIPRSINYVIKLCLLYILLKSKMDWSVVNFNDDNSVEVIPVNWLIGDDKAACRWPPHRGSHLRNAIMSGRSQLRHGRFMLCGYSALMVSQS